jgi:ABC-type transport system substrate-binding protein
MPEMIDPAAALVFAAGTKLGRGDCVSRFRRVRRPRSGLGHEHQPRPVNPPLPANGDKAWFGWPTDDKLEELRGEWLQASDSETRQEIAARVQQRAFETVPYIPTG